MKSRLHIVCLLGITLFYFVESQASEQVRIVFWNVENYFDCIDDSLKADEEFLPSGLRGWTPFRFWKKTGHIARVLAVLHFPPIVGLAEVENDYCLQQLTRVSPLKNAGYSFIHFESSDVRGVDVCLLYNPYVFHPLVNRPLAVLFQGEPGKKTRDVLYVCGLVNGRDSLHLFVCHLPSRLGGEAETDPYRCQVAFVIKGVTDSILQQTPAARVLIMGDFNDCPDSPSLKRVLGAENPYNSDSFQVKKQLYNLMYTYVGKVETGTHKHQSEWGILDHIIVSESVLSTKGKAVIFSPDFLLMPDSRWLGIKPFRTYYGMTYQGGYSDHLPVYTDVEFIQ